MKFLELFQNWDDTVEFDADSVIFTEGDPAVLYVILSGEVELELRGESLGIEAAGGIIGEMALIPSAKNSTTAKTLTRVKLARLDRDKLRVMINQNADFSLHVMAVLASRLRKVDRFIAKRI